ncbi:nuclear GTPase SLIP-GC [Nematolebias whitei]|uniref:nuclear GTPase SLIP-GC n=1 Tax=Nematolebias whitei TaxID=451745 RepID=UPI0018994C7D|nr:nuclear GTPase SLIP-GC [Nematolebias whitei]
MDEFVRGKLNEWGLSECIKSFQEEAIDEEMFKSLEKPDIDQLIPKVKSRIIFRRKFKEFKCQLEQEEATGLTEVQPSTSDAGKRKRDLHGESSKQQTPAKRNCRAELKDAKIRHRVKEIMDGVLAQLDKQNNTDLNQFLKKNIKDLERDKRELVGVFGKTGAGKSSLINAVVGEKKLLPSGKVSACTSVITKVESNMQNEHYEAEIEFIGKEAWKAEVWSMLNFLENNPDEERSHDEKDEDEDDNNDDSDDKNNNDDDDDDDERNDNIEKLSALYGEDWREKSFEELMDRKYFKYIHEYWETPKVKILTFKTVSNFQLITQSIL